MTDSLPKMDLVWQNTLDEGKYRAFVERTGPYKGTLNVALCVDGSLLHTEEVGLAYGALFGPDVDDVNTWCERVVDVIDNPEKRVSQ